jgi:TfoX/Sxy family transcriptional regulator of competence genes
VGVFYHIMTLRNTTKNQELSRKAQELTAETRQAQLFIQICNQTLNNPAFMKGYYIIRESEWKDFDEYIEWLGEPGSENFNDVFLVGGTLESIGVLVEEGLVDIRLVESLMRRVVIEYWEKIGQMLDERARLWSQERAEREQLLLVWKAEYLYHELMKYIEEHPELKT